MDGGCSAPHEILSKLRIQIQFPGTDRLPDNYHSVASVSVTSKQHDMLMFPLLILYISPLSIKALCESIEKGKNH